MEESDAAEGVAVQLIDGEGEFAAEGAERFMAAAGVAGCGLSYAVVSIMGPQSSGKSTLLNQLFGTNFREMDAFRGRSQTTKGIWIARCVGVEPCTVVLDLEGTDGRERGEDDTAFEKQSSLFALAISDIVLINMWCHDIGREQAANKPLLKTVFQVMMRLFSPRKTTLLFVIRDKTRTPLEHLEPVLREDIQKIWNSVAKPEAHKDTPISEFFNVQVTALSSFEEKEDQFREQVQQLRQRFSNSIAPGGLAGDRRGVVPASGFLFSSQEIWKVIRENKDLDLPAHKVMVATVRCDEIANEKFGCITSDTEWLDVESAVQSGPVPGFGKKLGNIVEVHLQEYDKEAIYFDEAVRKGKRQHLESRILNLVQPAFQKMLTHLRTKALEKFKTGLNSSLESGKGFAVSARENTECSLKDFEQGCADAIIKQANWDCSKILEKVRRDIEDHALSIRESKLSELTTHAKEKLRKALAEPVESLFDAADQTTWTSIRNVYKRETEAILPEFLKTLCGFEMEYAPAEEMVSKLRDYARSVVESKAKEESSKVLIHMKDRFTTVFSHDKDSIPRVWTGKEDVRAIAKEARSAALKLLSVMVAIRWDDEPDRIESILTSTLLEGSVVSKIAHAASADPLASTTWEEIPPKHTMITPSQCKSLWKQFKSETEFTITQAVSTQQAHRRGNSKLPPPWAIVAIAILGFNEIMVLLRNPIYVFLLFVGYLMFKALAMQLDVSREFQNGVVPGIISVSAKLLPTIQNLVNKVAAEQQAEHQHPHPHPQAAEPPQPQMQPPPLLLSPRSPMSELRRLHMPSSPRKAVSPVPSSSSSSSAVSSPRHVGEDQKPRPGVGEPENQSTIADSIV